MPDPVDPLTERARARVGTVLREKWRLDRLLGVGGMAAVYAATHRNGARVAIKILHQQLSIDRDVRERFLREGYVANSVSHRGVVRVLDDDVTDDGAIFFVMDLLEGETLDARWTREGPRLPHGDVLSIADQVLDVLVAAHERGVIHRDIKPENVFVTTDGTAKLLDFGIARVRELSAASQATRAGAMLGTPAFMPPEQALGHVDQIDARSDLWGVGAMMFALLTGRLVHEGGTANEQLIAAATQPAPAVGEIAPGLPLPVREVVDRALAFHKGDRWADARTMQEAVRVAYVGRSAANESASSPATHPAPAVEAPAAPPGPPVDATASASRPATLTTGGRGSVGRTLGDDVGGRRAKQLAVAVLAGAAVLGMLAVIGLVRVLRARSHQTEPDAPLVGLPSEAPGAGSGGARSAARIQDLGPAEPAPAASPAAADGETSAAPQGSGGSAAPASSVGKLTVTARGGTCVVTVSGRAYGSTPLVGLVVSAATHAVTCRLPRGAVLVQTVRVKPDEAAHVVFALAGPGAPGTAVPMDRRR
jgi:serine/threonine-protein kinase